MIWSRIGFVKYHIKAAVPHQDGLTCGGSQWVNFPW
jgi:hypothetical protein